MFDEKVQYYKCIKNTSDFKLRNIKLRSKQISNNRLMCFWIYKYSLNVLLNIQIFSGARSFSIYSLAIPSFAISLTCYPLIYYQPHLLSPHLLSIHLLSVSLALGITCTQASLALATLAIRSISYQATLAFKTFAN